MEAPALTFAFEALVDIGAPVAMGETALGKRLFIPIVGGRFEGPDIAGEVIPGGADWQTVRPDGCTLIEAVYALRAADGAVIAVHNRGLVDPQAPGLVRTTPVFDAPRGPHDWLNRSVFVGTLAIANRERTTVRLRFFKVA
ncbi:MAG TPA: DUF3237 family protein [Phenylobacterium sp.]